MVSAALLAVLIASFTFLKDPILAKMNDWKLLPQPERFTELYFENHLDLPKSLKSRRV